MKALFWIGRILLMAGLGLGGAAICYFAYLFNQDPDLVNFTFMSRYGIDFFSGHAPETWRLTLPNILIGGGIALFLMGVYDGINRRSDVLNILASIVYMSVGAGLILYRDQTLAAIDNLAPSDWSVAVMALAMMIGTLPLFYAAVMLAFVRHYPANRDRYMHRA